MVSGNKGIITALERRALQYFRKQGGICERWSPIFFKEDTGQYAIVIDSRVLGEFNGLELAAEKVGKIEDWEGVPELTD